MPKVEINKKDLHSLLINKINDKELGILLESAKAELDDILTDTYKIELNDTNRPDLWSCVGLARQLNLYQHAKEYDYSFFTNKSNYQIIVDKNIKDIRPYIVGFAAKNIKITEPLLLELIQNQEKFAFNFGKKRDDIAIGIYKLAKIKFPVHYKAVPPKKIKFIPLGENVEMNLAEILEKHPKGIEFGHIVKGKNEYPIILDSNNNVLSFPPIINSKYIGEVAVGDKEIFIELTGFTLTNMLLVANIFACDLVDRGAEIIPVKIVYPYQTEYGKSFVVPYDFKNKMNVNINEFSKIMGFEPKKVDIKENLKKMGYKNIKIDKNKISVAIPSYRNDIMHLVDIVEDYVIGKGYNNFESNLPSEFTIGSLSAIELFSDKLRNIAIGMEFQEVISNILTSEQNIYTKMNMTKKDAAEISNPMAESYNVLQNSIIPALLEVETFSAKAYYPHRIFEVGEVVIKDPTDNSGFRTRLNMTLLNAHTKANFSEMRSYIDNILFYVGINNFELVNIDLPYFLKGRSAQIINNKKVLGYFGEIHPSILENWDINMPCAVIELFADELMTGSKK